MASYKSHSSEALAKAIGELKVKADRATEYLLAAEETRSTAREAAIHAEDELVTALSYYMEKFPAVLVERALNVLASRRTEKQVEVPDDAGGA